MNPTALVQHFDLAPHPEGGFYRETYRSPLHLADEALGNGFGGPRSVSTAILYLLRQGEYSHLHRIRQDEIWHYHLGGPLRLAVVSPDGQAREIVLGPDVEGGQLVQYIVPGGSWFGATPAAGSVFTLVGCTVAPGFDFADFELGRQEELLRRFPAAAACLHEFALA